MQLINSFKSVLHNIAGWRTNRKIVVFESDDWGSIRMPSKEVYIKCLKSGYPVDKNPYERYDSLASADDLNLLFDLLGKFNDSNNKKPQITANCVVANPNFEKIQKDNFDNYHYELITETFQKYPKHNRNFETWMQAKEENLFFPQFHAREHLNVSKFMIALKNNDKDVHWGFQNMMPGSIRKGQQRNGNYFVEATKYEDIEDKNQKLSIYLEGLDIFENLFGYKSKSIIPPNYTWNKEFDFFTFEKGVLFNQGIRKMKVPLEGENYSRYMGQMNAVGQINTVRNCFFEPSLNFDIDSVDRCLRDISIAFRMNKPAIISCHRLNFVGHIDEKNRDVNLQNFSKLLSKMLNIWPGIEFLNTVELGNLILNSK